MIEAIAERGFVMIEQRLSPAQIAELLAAMSAIDAQVPGTRGMAAKVPAVQTLARSDAIQELITPVLGRGALLVRSILFNKAATVNWHVAWHQDVTIPVLDKHEVPGFTAWSVKEGVLHVHAPVGVLERMLTLRLHLDTADADNGALWIAPGSHRYGHISEEAPILECCGTHLCVAEPGDALLMRPLLLHASRKTVSDRPRRVLHLEFAAGDALVPPLRWAPA